MEGLTYLTPLRLKLREATRAKIALEERLAAERYAARAADNAATHLPDTTSRGERVLN